MYIWASWGDTRLRIKNGSYRPPEAETRITEIKILSNPSTPTVPATVLQQGGAERKRTSFAGYVRSLDEYSDLQSDKLHATVRTFTGPMGETLTGIIEVLNITDIFPPKIYSIGYVMTIVEAEDLEGEEA